MIEGLHIINQITEKHYTVGISALIFGIVLITIALICLIPVIITINEYRIKKSISDKGSFILSTIFGVILLGLGTFSTEIFFTRTQYLTTKIQATIDDTVKFNEINNTYDIISHEGDVYILQNKLDNQIKKTN